MIKKMKKERIIFEFIQIIKQPNINLTKIKPRKRESQTYKKQNQTKTKWN